MTAVLSSPSPLIERAAFRFEIRGVAPPFGLKYGVLPRHLYRTSRARASFPRFPPSFSLKPGLTYSRLSRYPIWQRVLSVRACLILLLLPLAAVAAGGAPAARDSGGTGRPSLRYVFNSGSAQGSAAAAGWNLLDVSSKDEADALPAGTRGLMWLGDYDNTTCDWERSDGELGRLLAGTAGDQRIYGFLFSDEADPFACPNAPAQHRARAELVRRLSGGKLTVIV